MSPPLSSYGIMKYDNIAGYVVFVRNEGALHAHFCLLVRMFILGEYNELKEPSTSISD